MSDLSDLNAKLDTLIAHVGTVATRDEIVEMHASIRGEIAGLRSEMRGEIAEIRAEMLEMRLAIMSRIDRLQDAFTLLHDERIVDIGSAERAERMAKAAREDASAIGNIVTPLIRLVHGIRTQLDDLSEQVRVLKEGRAA